MQLPRFQLTPSSRIPAWRLTINDKEVTAQLTDRLISLTLTDNRGFEADTLNISIDDSDGLVAIPDKGAKLQLYLGWTGAPLIDKGGYIVDTIEHSGTPDTLTLSAKSADFRESLIEKKSVSYPAQTIASLVATIAKKHQLKHRVSQRLANIQLTHKIQSNESDANLLTRLAAEHDAVASIKNDYLLFIGAGEGKTSSGKSIPRLTITRGDGDNHRYARSEREKYTGVKAYWNDLRHGKKQWELAGKADKTTSLKKAFPNQQAAQNAADAELQRLNRGVATFTIRLAFAMPHLFPETPVKAKNFKPVIDKINWVTTRAVHELGDSGFITSVECEQKNKQKK